MPERPDQEELRAVARSIGLSLSPEELDDYVGLVGTAVSGAGEPASIEPVEAVLEPDAASARGEAYRPDPEEDPLNAWLLKLTVDPLGEGPLSGVTVGLKDSIALAGYEMTAGSTVLEGFVPRIDAPVVSRLLNSGATIVGKLNMESFAWSARGDLSDFGIVRNPHDDEYLAGGSSSGSGVAPVVGDCDVAIGTDQAGSIRIPSSWCGLVGIKPTHGLVPYTGILPLEHSIDHVGPMATSVQRVAETLTAIAGEVTSNGIRLDDRQPHGIEGEEYTEALGEPVDDLAIGVIEEGFGWPASERVVDDTVRDAITKIEPRVESVEEVRLPLLRQAVAIWAPIASAGGVSTLQHAGMGINTRSWAWPELVDFLDRNFESRIDQLPPSVKRTMLAAEYAKQYIGNSGYANARDGVIVARRRIDTLLDTYDALALPTTVVQPFEVGSDPGRVEKLHGSGSAILNTCLFNATGHPAMSIPVGKPNGLPVGLMFVGSHFDEATLFRLGSEMESIVGA